MHLDHRDYLTAGFFITKRVKRPTYCSGDLLPDYLLSASPCLGTFIPDTWCIAWTGDTPEFRWEKAAAFGLTEDDLKLLTQFVTPRIEESFKWPNVCSSLAAARELVHGFLAAQPDIVIFELALPQQYADEFRLAAEPPPPQEGFAPWGRQGVHEMILKGQPILGTGNPLGFEPLVFEYSLSCSWLCNGLEVIVHRDLGIAPNPFGFIGSLTEAVRCVAHISREDVGAEPGLWLPWLIVDHTKEVGQAA